jgi:hypothetical protein
METTAIRVYVEHSGNEEIHQFRFSIHKRIGGILDSVISDLKLPTKDDGKPVKYEILHVNLHVTDKGISGWSGRSLSLNDTLASSGIEYGDTLLVRTVRNPHLTVDEEYADISGEISISFTGAWSAGEWSKLMDSIIKLYNIFYAMEITFKELSRRRAEKYAYLESLAAKRIWWRRAEIREAHPVSINFHFPSVSILAIFRDIDSYQPAEAKLEVKKIKYGSDGTINLLGIPQIIREIRICFERIHDRIVNRKVASATARADEAEANARKAKAILQESYFDMKTQILKRLRDRYDEYLEYGGALTDYVEMEAFLSRLEAELADLFDSKDLHLVPGNVGNPRTNAQEDE